MADKVKLSKDGTSIDFIVSENIPASVKKFRHSPEIEGLYRFIFENDLQKEAFEILDRIVGARKAKKLKEKQDAMPPKKVDAPKAEAKAKKVEPVAPAKPAAKTILKPAVVAKPAVKAAPAKVAPKAAAKKVEVKKPAAKKK
jgi:hypothetical protein